jgi:hypothetical protein
MPTTEQQIEGIVAKLGDLGLDAIAGMLADADPTMEPNVGNSPSTLT